MRAAAPQVVIALLALALGVAFFVLDPSRSLRPDAALRLLSGLGGALTWAFAALGGGGALLSGVDPALLEGRLGWLHALLAGLLAWGLLMLGMGAFGLLQPGPILGLGLLLGAGWLRCPALRLPQLSPALGLALVLVGLPGLIDALAPPIDTDELYYHLALPQQLLQAGGLVGGVLDPSGSRPLALHLPFAALLATAGPAAPKLFHLLLSLLLLLGVHALGRRELGDRAAALAVLLLAGSYSVAHDAGLAANNLPTALAVLGATDAALRGRARGLALAAGLALGLKYTAAAAILGLFLVARLSPARRLAAGIAALALVSPWWLRNLAEGLHPLFPFAGWPGEGATYQYLERYGAGRGLRDLLLLPWNALMTAELDSNRFLGRLNPLWGLGLVLAPVAARRPGAARRLVLAGLVVCLGWAAGPHWLRYLLPGIGILALAAAAGIDGAVGARPPAAGRWALGAAAACWILGLPANLGPAWSDAFRRLPAASGATPADAFYEASHGPWPAVRWANAHLPEDAVVALFFDWSGGLLERPFHLGSVEDHVPSRHWLKTHGDQSLAALQAEGVSHVMVRRVRFLTKAYPFLSAEALQADFNGPVADLDELLLQQATLIFEENGSRIYRIDGPAPAPETEALQLP